MNTETIRSPPPPLSIKKIRKLNIQLLNSHYNKLPLYWLQKKSVKHNYLKICHHWWKPINQITHILEFSISHKTKYSLVIQN